MPRREELYLADILTACRHVAAFLDGRSLDDWIEDELLQFGVLQRLTVIGEAARQLDPVVRERYPEVPWRDLTAFRNLAVPRLFRCGVGAGLGDRAGGRSRVACTAPGDPRRGLPAGAGGA